VPLGAESVEIRFQRAVASGAYLIALHGYDEMVSKQFIIIK
jgi:hypothetical protein